MFAQFLVSIILGILLCLLLYTMYVNLHLIMNDCLLTSKLYDFQNYHLDNIRQVALTLFSDMILESGRCTIKRLGTGADILWRQFKTLVFIYVSDINLCFQARNKEQEEEVLNWIFAVLGEPVPKGAYEDILKDGIVLCKLINKLAPGSVKKIQERGTNFQLMENIQRSIIYVHIFIYL